MKKLVIIHLGLISSIILIFGLIMPVCTQQAVTSATLSGRVEDVNGAAIGGAKAK